MERRSMRFSLKSKLDILMTGRGWQQGDKLIAVTTGKQRARPRVALDAVGEWHGEGAIL
jgi:hypothetical protein